MNEGWIDLSIDLLVKAPWNYKEDDEERQTKLTENIRQNKQVENLIVRPLDDGRFEIVNGNHRYDSFLEVGIKSIHCFNTGPISVERAQLIATQTNETRFPSNHLKFAEMMTNLLNFFPMNELVKTLPYSEDEIMEFKKLAEFDWAQFDNSASDQDLQNKMEKDNWVEIKIKVPIEIHSQFEEQLDRFKRALYPDEKPSKVSPVTPLEAMLQHVAQIPDDQLV